MLTESAFDDDFETISDISDQDEESTGSPERNKLDARRRLEDYLEQKRLQSEIDF